MKVLHIPYLGSSNPYQDNLFKHLRKDGIIVTTERTNEDYDCIHLHWIGPLCIYEKLIPSIRDATKLCLFLIYNKCKKIKIIWTIHNLIGHESKHKHIELFINRILYRICDTIIVHGDHLKKIVEEYQPNIKKKIIAVTHPNYIENYINNITKSEARSHLGIDEDKLVFLLFGEIRPYKGFLEFSEIFNEIFLKNKNVILLIVGRVNDPFLKKRINDLTKYNSNIIFLPKFIKEDSVQYYMNSSDIVIFPYRNLFTSGAIALAMTFHKACIAPKTGCVPDMLDTKGAYLYNPHNEKTELKQILQECLNNKEKLNFMGNYNFYKATQWRWDSLSKIHKSIYLKDSDKI